MREHGARQAGKDDRGWYMDDTKLGRWRPGAAVAALLKESEDPQIDLHALIVTHESRGTWEEPSEGAA
ncbi:MAG: hypothetical protein AAF715_28770 [Myxococcota bacterium]